MATAEEIKELLRLENLTTKSDKQLEETFSGKDEIPGFKDEIARRTSIDNVELFKKSVRDYSLLVQALNNLKAFFADKAFEFEIEGIAGHRMTYNQHALINIIERALNKLSCERTDVKPMIIYIKKIKDILEQVKIRHPNMVE